MKKVFVIALIAAVSIGSLSADIFETIKKKMTPEIKSTTVTIGSGVRFPRLDVVFQALGCADRYVGRTGLGYGLYHFNFVCKKVYQLEPGQSVTYNWKWGQTNKKVRIVKRTFKRMKGWSADLIATYSGDQLKKPIVYNGK